MKQMIYKPDREIDVLEEGTYKGYDYVIVSYGTHPCAYVEMPKDSPYFGLEYSELEDVIHCHGGLTYSGELDHIYENDHRWFMGWDYAHAGDYAGYDILFNYSSREKDKKWTTEEIHEEVLNVIDQLKGVA